MNNTKRTLSLVAILMAATLVIGTFATTTIGTTQAAFAYPQKNKGDDNSRNGNTVTIQKCKQAAIQSGWDNDQEQECENLICTHPGENATCSQEGAAAVTPTPTSPPIKKTCEQCFTSLLSEAQINDILFRLTKLTGSVADLCALLETGEISGDLFSIALDFAGITDATTRNELVACLKDAGIVFAT